MIRSFRHRGLARLWNEDDGRGIPSELLERIRRTLAALDAALSLFDLRLPGWRLHRLRGNASGRLALSVNGPWRLTFEWIEDDVWRLDLEQYH